MPDILVDEDAARELARLRRVRERYTVRPVPVIRDTPASLEESRRQMRAWLADIDTTPRVIVVAPSRDGRNRAYPRNVSILAGPIFGNRRAVPRKRKR